VVTQNTALPARFQADARPDDDAIEILRDDAGIVALFFALDTQWRRHPFSGQLAGLDYAAIKPTAELAGVEITPATLPGLRAMEQSALATLAEATK
jgi:hypothetical protein